MESLMRNNPQELRNNIPGILLMLLNAFSLSVLYTCSKKLRVVFEAEQLTFLYKSIVFVCSIPWIFYKHRSLSVLKTSRVGLHFMRGLSAFLGSLLFYHSILYVNTTEVAAFTYLEPLIVTILSIVLFKEKYHIGTIIFISCGLIGNILVFSSGYNSQHTAPLIGYMYLIFALLCWGANNIFIKMLGNTERTATQLFYNVFLGTAFSIPLAFRYVWTIDLSYIPYILLMGAAHVVHIISFFKAFKLSPVSVVFPFDYTRLIFTALLAYLFLGQNLTVMTITGCVIIIVGGVFMVYSEARTKHGLKQIRHNIESEVVNK
ncbi:DMT family transporter [Candidatus Fokinia crypta]|nr:DMT family transporter [Candidatus Fokinia cryptica]